MEIGKKLKDARMKSGFTQETVAEKINVSRQTISNWENEKSYPDIISVIELSSLYSISLDDLLKGDERMMEHILSDYDILSGYCELSSIALSDYQTYLREKYNGQKYCIGCDIWCGRSCRSYGNGISDLSVNGDGCSRPWIKTSKIMGTACCERE